MKYYQLIILINLILIKSSTQLSSSKILILSFSRPGENYGVGIVEIGNTELISNYIQKITNGVLHKIEPLNPYPELLNETMKIVREEQNLNLRPKIKNLLTDISNYEIIFLGYPIWYTHLPNIVINQLEQLNFTNKTIYPFCTHGGSEYNISISDIEKYTKGAIIKNCFSKKGLYVRKSDNLAKNDILEWLNGINIKINNDNIIDNYINNASINEINNNINCSDNQINSDLGCNNNCGVWINSNIKYNFIYILLIGLFGI